MTPKKKSGYTPLIYAGIVLIALYVSAQLAAAVSYAELYGAAQSSFYMTVLNYFSDTVTNTPFHFVICEHTGKYMLYGGIGTIVVLLAIENSKKNYIHGKEFGTAKWGTLNDIKDLFADTIMNEEIKRAKEVKHRYGRWKARQKIYDSIKKEAKKRLDDEIAKLKEEEAKNKRDGHGNDRLLLEKIGVAKEESKKWIAEQRATRWKPDGLYKRYEERLKAIEESPFYTPQDKVKEKAKAKTEYEDALRDFYHGKTDIEKIRRKYKNADMLFTRTERISLYNFKLNNNTLILGGSGSGKTRGFVMPNILQAHSSYVVTDPKGEILEKAGGFLEHEGYKIRVLNLDNKAASDGYNPFLYLRQGEESYEERVLSLIEAIIINSDGGEKKGGSDPFWDKAERLFLQAIFFFTSTAFKPQDQNMNTVLELIAMLDIAEEQDDMDSDLDIFAEMFENRFGKDHIGSRQWHEFRSKASGKTAKSIVISAVARLAPFQTQAVRRIFSYDSMHLDRLGEEKTAIFVVVPPTDTTFNFIAGMVFTQMFAELQYCATQVHKHDGQRLPVPVRFILDEFANTCTIPNFVKILAYARSFGVGIVPILQSLEQIKNMYKDEWGVIVDNCNTLLYLGSITHMDTLEYMSKLLGKGTFDKRTTGRTRGRQGSSSENFDVIGRELMDASEIRKLPKQNCILVVGGRNPFYSEKYDYPSHPNYQFTSDGGGKSYEYVPEPPPPKPEPKKKAVSKAEEKPEVKPDKDSVVEVDKIITNTDANETLQSVVNGNTPLTDEMILVEDGEKKTEFADFTAAVEKVQEQRRSETEVLTDRITFDTDFKTMVQSIQRNLHRMKPLENTMVTVDEGENAREPEAQETPEAPAEGTPEIHKTEQDAPENTHGEYGETAGLDEFSFDSDTGKDVEEAIKALNDGIDSLNLDDLDGILTSSGEVGAADPMPPGAEQNPK